MGFAKRCQSMVRGWRKLLSGKQAALICSIFFGVVLVWEVANHLGMAQGNQKLRFLIADREIPKGSELVFQDLSYVSEIQSVGNQECLTDQQLHLLSGLVSKSEIKRGDRICHDLLEYRSEPIIGSLVSKIPPGFRAYSIRPRNSPLLRSGDKVDVFGSLEGGGSRLAPLLEGVTVLQTRPRLTLAISAEDVGMIESAETEGKLTVALRNPLDKNTIPKPFKPIISKKPRERNIHSIEVLAEGE